MTKPTSGVDEWYSDEALRKQAEARSYSEGEPPPLSLLFGLLEPRTQPDLHERCHHCGGDGRDGAGGAEVKGVRWCSLCLSRGRDDDYEPEPPKGSSSAGAAS